jgi:hypothetical protein
VHEADGAGFLGDLEERGDGGFGGPDVGEGE